MKIGDMITCYDTDDTLEAMTQLCRHGIDTDFLRYPAGNIIPNTLVITSTCETAAGCSRVELD